MDSERPTPFLALPPLDVLRTRLVQARQNLPDRLKRAEALQSVLRAWLVGRTETAIGAYWPIKGEFDPLPALFRWSEAVPGRQIGLPVVDRETHALRFRQWYPGCPTELDAYDIPKPKDTPEFTPQLLLLPCVGYGPAGVRLGYGGGFVARTLMTLTPHPYCVGLCYSHAFVPMLRSTQEGVQTLDALLTDDGLSWERS
jgi:5-formyltetrahydrofolate cyclo-ligase